MSNLKERFDEAFYKLLNVGDRLNKISEKLEYANKIIKLNKEKQNEIKEILNNLS